MRSLSTSLSLIVAFIASAGFSSPYEDLVDERTQSPMRVCEQDQSCGRNASTEIGTPVANETTAPRSAKSIYQAGCAACHDAGVGGAPKLVADAWTERLQKGRPTLVQHAINGFGSMPAKGVCINCSDEEIELAVEYMLEASGL
ncbi:MAG: c-type cytochrome [Gammaproteobacteria bacterium]